MDRLDYQGQAYFRAEALIDLLIERLDAQGIELSVYQDELSEDTILATRENLRGFAAAIIVLINEYLVMTADMSRGAVYLEHLEKLEAIVNA